MLEFITELSEHVGRLRSTENTAYEKKTSTVARHPQDEKETSDATNKLCEVLSQVLQSAYNRTLKRSTSGRPEPSQQLPLIPTPCSINRSVPDLIQLRSERVRLETFYDWPTTAPVKPTDLAAAGLFYTGHADRVRCVFCSGALHHWVEGDEPVNEHRRHFLECPFVQGLDVGNVPTNETSVEKMRPLSSLRQSTPPSASQQLLTRTPHDVNVRGSVSSYDVTRCNDVNKVARPGIALTTENSTAAATVAVAAASAGVEDDEEQKLLEENRKLIEARICKVCMDKDVNTVFLPCGHLISCQECAPKLRDCPLCRTYIRGTVRTFLS